MEVRLTYGTGVGLLAGQGVCLGVGSEVGIFVGSEVDLADGRSVGVVVVVAGASVGSVMEGFDLFVPST